MPNTPRHANAVAPNPLDAKTVMLEAMCESALRSARLAEETGLAHDRIILSAKVSGVQDLIAVYRMLAARCDYPLHLGLTEAGLGTKGVVSSTAGLAVLLQEGIGDTIRISLTPRPGGDRTEEVLVAQQILQSLGLRSFTPQVTACPGCGRTTSTFFQRMAEDIQTYLREQMRTIQKELGESEEIAEVDELRGAIEEANMPEEAAQQARKELRRLEQMPEASGEYSMVKAAAKQGWINEEQVVVENMYAFARSGADIIITYHARDLVEKGWM